MSPFRCLTPETRRGLMLALDAGRLAPPTPRWPSSVMSVPSLRNRSRASSGGSPRSE